MKSFLQRFFLKPPIFFPLLALFHWLWVVVHFVPFEFGSTMYQLTGCWKVAAAVLCTLIALLKRWAGIGYILLTCAGYCLYYFCRESNADLSLLGKCMFPLDIIVCFLVLFFYKRLEGWPAGAK